MTANIKNDKSSLKILGETNIIKKEFLTYIITRLSSIKRYNTRKFIIPQNVLEHEGSVALIAMVFSDYFNKIGIKNNTEKVMRIAILHDTDEIISGDLPHDSKYEFGSISDDIRKSLERLEHETIELILSKNPNNEINDKYRDLFNEAKGKKTIESLIVKLADFSDVEIYSVIEENLGNKTICLEKENAHKRFTELLFRILKENEVVK